MRLACASSAFGRAFERGDLTQLEFVDACARELSCDGVVLDVRHFPRLDNDYLAQIKKMTTDLGLTVAAFADDDLFFADAEAMASALERTWRLGAPLVTARLARENDVSWSEQIESIGRACALAKGANVTIAVRNAPGTYAATEHDCKRLVKEADSAWLRLGLQPSALDVAADPSKLAAHTVLLFGEAGTPPQSDRVEAFAHFRGFLALDRADGNVTREEMRASIKVRKF
jgi:sugar phosphate isomerase/epimerase